MDSPIPILFLPFKPTGTPPVVETHSTLWAVNVLSLQLPNELMSMADSTIAYLPSFIGMRSRPGASYY